MSPDQAVRAAVAELELRRRTAGRSQVYHERLVQDLRHEAALIQINTDHQVLAGLLIEAAEQIEQANARISEMDSVIDKTRSRQAEAEELAERLSEVLNRR